MGLTSLGEDALLQEVRLRGTCGCFDDSMI
jgi:hypothetical protein